MSTTPTYKTTDIVLAAFLKLQGYNMVTIEKQGLKGTFVFEDVPNDVVTSYDLGQCSVEPVSFNNTLKALTTSVRRMQ